MGCFRLEDSSESRRVRFECWVRGHDTEVIDQVLHKGSEPEDDPPPEPKPGVVYIEQFYLLHWLREVHVELIQCKRCKAVWRREKSCKGGPPKRLSQWMSMYVDGRVIAPPV